MFKASLSQAVVSELRFGGVALTVLQAPVDSLQQIHLANHGFHEADRKAIKAKRGCAWR